MSFIIPSVQQVQIPDNDLLLFGDGVDGHFSSVGTTNLTAASHDTEVISRSYLSFIVNEGHTFQAITNRNRGLIIRVLGDATINGIISNNNLAARVVRNEASSPFDAVAAVPARNITIPFSSIPNFLIPTGGNGGNGGNGGGSGVVGAAGGTNSAYGGNGGGGGGVGGGSGGTGGGGGGAGGGVIGIFHRGAFLNNGSLQVSGSLGGATGVGNNVHAAIGGGGGGGGAGNGGNGGGGGVTMTVGGVGGGTGGIGGNGTTAEPPSRGGAGGVGGGGLIILMVRGNLTIGSTGLIMANSTGAGGRGGDTSGGGIGTNGISGQVGQIIIRRI